MKLGAELVKLLLERIAGGLPAEPQCRLIEPQLVPVKIPAERRLT